MGSALNEENNRLLLQIAKLRRSLKLWKKRFRNLQRKAIVLTELTPEDKQRLCKAAEEMKAEPTRIITSSWSHPSGDIKANLQKIKEMILAETNGQVQPRLPDEHETRIAAMLENNPPPADWLKDKCEDHYSGLNGICDKCGKP